MDKYPSLASKPKAILFGNFSHASFKKFLSFIAALPKITFSTPASVYFWILSKFLIPPPISILRSNLVTISWIISKLTVSPVKALTGETVNLDIIQEIVTKFDLKIEIGGGIRNFESIQKYTDAGVEKVILGSAAIKDKNFLKEACEKFPNKIALGLDAKDGYLSISGWRENSNQLTLDYLKEVNNYGVSRLIYTDINRDGMKQSPNFEETSKVAEKSNCPVIISGGVSSMDDIKKAKTLKNIEGIIVGKAIYDGDIKLEDLVKEDA